MCGIAGWIDWEQDLTQNRPVLEKMTETLTPRGPDASGYWISPRAAIGHRRLIVVDPTGGAQPMVRHFGDQTYVLTYNGELYNTEEIRQDLKTLGFTFKSYSDTEVLLLSYVAWGPGCLDRFNGIYAFGIWSEYEQTLFLGRDRMGVKPLFYSTKGNSFIFGSEIKVLLAHPTLQPELDLQGIAEVFGLGPARTPGYGVFKGIDELRPGCWLRYTRDGLKIERYWSLRSEPHTDSLETSVQRVRELVEDSIDRQLVSDVPVCTFLSGGLDSSIISAIAARTYRRDGKEPLQTYSVDYLENDKYFTPSDFQPNADAPWIQKVNGFLGTRNRQITIDNTQLAKALRAAVLARDLPGMADVDSSLYLFCREIKKGATVALSGECADEVFGGYPWFYREDALGADTFPWSLSLGFREHIVNPEIKPHLHLTEYVQDRYQEALAEMSRLPGEDPLEERRRKIFYLNIHWFMAVLLDRKDRMSMASGLEVRVPFCDHRLVEYVWNIPWSFKYYGGREKGILRKAVQGLLPQDVIYRRKSPYPKTHHPGYLSAVTENLMAIVNNPAEPLHQLIDIPALKKFILEDGAVLSKPWFGQLMNGPQLLAYLIQMDIWLKEYGIKIKTS
jgi:asparagine synthase (glutamine-hydrolysing)